MMGKSILGGTLLNSEDLPKLFREPHVDTGYRLPNQPWKYYINSVTQYHNESMNIWTHVLAIIVLVYKMAVYHQALDFVYNPYSWPLLAACFTNLTLFACSVVAHSLHSKNEIIHYTCWMIDYAGIGVYGVGVGLMHFYYNSEDEFYNSMKKVYTPVTIALGLFCCIGCCGSKVHFQTATPPRKVWQFISVGSIYSWIASPIIHRMYNCYIFNYGCDKSISLHTCQKLWFLGSAFMHGSHLPEKVFPGSCDFLLNSHQLFHVFVMMNSFANLEAVFTDILHRRHIYELRFTPTFFGTFAPVFAVIAAETIVIIILREFAKKKCLMNEASPVKSD